jgi:hypothetical protein
MHRHRQTCWQPLGKSLRPHIPVTSTGRVRTDLSITVRQFAGTVGQKGLNAKVSASSGPPEAYRPAARGTFAALANTLSGDILRRPWRDQLVSGADYMLASDPLYRPCVL